MKINYNIILQIILGHGTKGLPPDKAGRLKDIVIWWHTITFILVTILFLVHWHCILDTDINSPLNSFGYKWMGNLSFSHTSRSLTFPKLNKNGLLIGRSHIHLLWGVCRPHPSELCRTLPIQKIIECGKPTNSSSANEWDIPGQRGLSFSPTAIPARCFLASGCLWYFHCLFCCIGLPYEDFG